MGTKIATAVVHAVVRTQNRVARFAKDTRAVSTVEYALIVIAVIAIVGVAAGILGGQFQALFNTLGNELTNGITNVKANASS